VRTFWRCLPGELVCGGIFRSANENNPPAHPDHRQPRQDFSLPKGHRFICKGGLVSDPSHVNFDGILPPSWKAELVIFILAASAANEGSPRVNHHCPTNYRLSHCQTSVEIALNRQPEHIVSPK
jgi:hypothetical protein